MLARPMDVLTAFPVRKTKAQKQAFRDAVQSYAMELGYVCSTETGIWGCRNLLIGDPATAKYLVTCRDSLSGIVTLLEIVRTLPENRRDKVCFVLLDGKQLGAISYRSAHKEPTEHQLVLELSEVGSGDRIRMFPTKMLKGDRKRLTALYQACGYFGRKNVLVEETKPLSGYTPFPYTAVICAVQDGKKPTYRNRTRTAEQTTLDETNVNILRAAITTLITCGAAQ